MQRAMIDGIAWAAGFVLGFAIMMAAVELIKFSAKAEFAQELADSLGADLEKVRRAARN